MSNTEAIDEMDGKGGVMANYEADAVCAVCKTQPNPGTPVVEFSQVHSAWADRFQISELRGFVCLKHLVNASG